MPRKPACESKCSSLCRNHDPQDNDSITDRGECFHGHRVDTPEVKQFKEALKSAFNRSELEQVVYYGLGVPFDEIVADSNFDKEVNDLVMWANKNNKVAPLLRKRGRKTLATSPCGSLMNTSGLRGRRNRVSPFNLLIRSKDSKGS